MRLLFCLLLAAVCSLLGVFFLWLKLRRVKNEKPILERLVPVPGKGYGIHPENGEAVCPRCAAAGVVSCMSLQGSNYLCWACMKGVIK